MADREKLIDLRREGEEIAENFCVSKQECYQCPYNAPNGCKEGLISDHLIANGVTIPKWIPVTERLPRYNEEVLVYRPKMAMKIYVSSYEGYYGEDDDEWHEGWGICGDITHWMPLPEPPKGE